MNWEMHVALLVLGFVGAKGSGKTSIARALVDRHGFENLHMGRPLKDMLRALGLSEDAVAGSPAQRDAAQPILGGKSARYALSTLGTDWGRNMISSNLWANAVRAKIEDRLLHPPILPIVIDDLRFPSDWSVIEAFGGLIVRVRRPKVEANRSFLDRAYYRSGLRRLVPARGILGWAPVHETEFHWRDAPACGEIENSKSLNEAVSDTIALIASKGRWTGEAPGRAVLLEDVARPADP